MFDGFNLEIEGFGQINEAKIEIGKINVVAGVNSSGKSTASKLLYCFLKSMTLNRKDYVFASILPDINRFINYMAKPKQYLGNDLEGRFTLDNNLDEILLDYFDAKEKYDGLRNRIMNSEITDDLKHEIDKSIKILLDDNEPGSSSIDRYLLESSKIKTDDRSGYDDSFYRKSNSTILKSLFKNESLGDFQGKSSLHNDSFKASVSYVYTGDDHFGRLERFIDLTKEVSKDDFDDFDDRFIYLTEGHFEFLNDVFYIDSISTFDADYYISKDKKIKEVFGYKEHIESLLKQLRNDDYFKPDLSEEVIAKIDHVNGLINHIIDGHTYRTFKDIVSLNMDYYFIPEDSDKQFNINISSGIQQISIIQILLNNHKLIPGCFLIIDEPEVNLHPEWQFRFAEILVMLAKELDITVYLNSHSPMFIEAIDAFTEFYDMRDDVNYYLTQRLENEDKYNFTKIGSDELYKLYDNLGNGYKLINELRLKKRLNR